MNVPFQAIHFMTYEFLQEHFNPQRRYNPSSHVLSGACAGAVAAAATTPLDVCKTLLNTQESLALNSNLTGHITGMASAFRTVYQVGGVTAYFRGVQARVIYQIPSTAIAWSVYEFFKYLITKRQEEWRAGKWSSTKWNQGSASTDALPAPAMFSVLGRTPASGGGRKAEGSLSPGSGCLADTSSCRPLRPPPFLPGPKQVQRVTPQHLWHSPSWAWWPALDCYRGISSSFPWFLIKSL